MQARFDPVRTREGILARRVPFHREEVEAAVRAVDVQLFRQVGAVTPRARSLSSPVARSSGSPDTGGSLPISAWTHLLLVLITGAACPVRGPNDPTCQGIPPGGAPAGGRPGAYPCWP